MENRIVALIDMDCFYVQVEQRCHPQLWNQPTAVVQYNNFYKGGLIAVSYEARARGVKRGMMCPEALAACPDLNLVTVPDQRGKADLSKYRQASQQVFRVLSGFREDVIVERASIDEAYLDLTAAVDGVLRSERTAGAGAAISTQDLPTSFLAVGQRQEFLDFVEKSAKQPQHLSDDNLRLLIGARLVEQVRKKIQEETQFHCSAGIAHNKMLAKLACSLHKPKQQTLIPAHSIQALFETTAIPNVRSLGGKLGQRVVEKLQVNTMGQLNSIPFATVKQYFGESTGLALHKMAQGLDEEPVLPRQISKSIGCSKNFPGRNCLCTKDLVQKWLRNLTEELEERLSEDRRANMRHPTTLVVGVQTELETMTSGCTRQTRLLSPTSDNIVKQANRLLREFDTAGPQSSQWQPPLTKLSLAAGKFEDSDDFGSILQITNFFHPVVDASSKPTTPPKRHCTVENRDLLVEGTPAKFTTSKSLNNEKLCASDQPKKTERRSFFARMAKTRSVDTKPDRNAVEDEKTREEFPNLQIEQASAEKPSCSRSIMLNVDEKLIKPLVSPNDIFIEKEEKETCRSEKPDVFAGPLECPEKRHEIDSEVWKNLPPEIQFELNSFYRKNEIIASGETEIEVISSKKKCATAGSTRKAALKIPDTKPKLKSSKAKHVPSSKKGVTLFDFYDKL